ncbi:uncharacterized protein FOBCDRAFT_203509 [Fusarium oxysporum Fo47]|uniref:uncharacterized protein n=1 Tax=Fusarium oxysporum Fo47 TaxID=660027 RepID=UPI002869C6C3|nr:uncharacterized protein FOBCDRAFT_203509 [Fusarium oxysporum Fo47]QKD56437.2 hypothetical protein FOBCDRAFT_203509 [Fusarium oxysporum Fo47]
MDGSFQESTLTLTGGAGQALCNYLNKTMNAESAARAITAGCLDRYPEGVAYGGSRRRNELWELLASTLLRFEDDCDMIVDLLVAIQTLPSMNSNPWWVTDPQPSDSLCELPSFHNVWQSCYESLRCQCHEGEDESFSVDKNYYRRAGKAEARMYLRGIPGITEFMGYKTINLICVQNEDLEFVIHEIHGWLQTAGSKLAETLDSNKIKFFERESSRNMKLETLSVDTLKAGEPNRSNDQGPATFVKTLGIESI